MDPRLVLLSHTEAAPVPAPTHCHQAPEAAGPALVPCPVLQRCLPVHPVPPKPTSSCKETTQVQDGPGMPGTLRQASRRCLISISGSHKAISRGSSEKKGQTTSTTHVAFGQMDIEIATVSMMLLGMVTEGWANTETLLPDNTPTSAVGHPRAQNSVRTFYPLQFNQTV